MFRFLLRAPVYGTHDQTHHSMGGHLSSKLVTRLTLVHTITCMWIAQETQRIPVEFTRDSVRCDLSPFKMNRLNSQGIVPKKKCSHLFRSRIAWLFCIMQFSVGKPHCICDPFAVSLSVFWHLQRITMQCGKRTGITAFPTLHMCEPRLGGKPGCVSFNKVFATSLQACVFVFLGSQARQFAKFTEYKTDFHSEQTQN